MLRSIRTLFYPVAVFAIVTVGVFIAQPKATYAVTAADWSAGNIIDDSKFYNSGEMSTNDIQVFLNSKMPSCDTWGAKTSEYGGGTRAQYGTSRGYPPPYTCLKDYSQNGVPAAQIIKNAANAYNINPRVLIVLLQKEQTLVTDDWPWSNQYRSATGYGCPDTAPCDAEYYGFTNQVTKAAFQFRRYATYPSEYRYKPYQNNTIQYNQNAGCGSSTVYIENLATAGLYNYTPYQPNASALNNLYGSGDGCGAYGNRNFWRLYSDWFGATKGSGYSWTLTSQYSYTDQTKTTPKSLQNLRIGDKAYIGFTVTNTGSVTWTNSGNNPVRVGTSAPYERQSTFANGSSWLGNSRPATMSESSVPPGGTATFGFWITANSAGSYNDRFSLLSENRTLMNDVGLSFGISVIPDSYTWSWNSQNSYTDQTKTTPKNLLDMIQGEKAYLVFSATNTGNVTWTNSGNNPVRVGTIAPKERVSRFADGSSWLWNSRPATMSESSVPPGGTATFGFWITANSAGSYNERFSLLSENRTWMNDVGLSFDFGVR